MLFNPPFFENSIRFMDVSHTVIHLPVKKKHTKVQKPCSPKVLKNACSHGQSTLFVLTVQSLK